MPNYYREFNLDQRTHPERLWVISQLEDYSNKVILDLGCGKHKTIPEALGVDIEPVTDIKSDISKLDMQNEMADFVISRHSLEHLLDPIISLKEWHRVLKSGGKLVIVLPDHSFVDTMSQVLSGGKHLHAYTRLSFANLLETIKLFKVLKMETVMENWSFGFVLEKT